MTMWKSVYTRAKTSDGRWASVNVLDLDDRSFRQFVLDKMCEDNQVLYLGTNADCDLTTPLTKEQAEGG